MPTAADDKSALWDQIEENYWQSTKAVRAREDRELEAYWRTVTEPLKIDLTKLYRERRELEDRLKQLNLSCFKAEADLSATEIGREANRETVAKKRAAEDEVKRNWFKDYRQGGPGSESSEVAHDEEDTGVEETRTQQPSNDAGSLVVEEADTQQLSNDTSSPAVKETDTQEPSNGTSSPVVDELKEPSGLAAKEPAPPQPSIEDVPDYQEPSEPKDQSSHQHDQNNQQQNQNGQQHQNGAPYGDTTGVEVYDGTGKLVGELHRINLTNHWVNSILNVPIQRAVAIRPGKKFNKTNLEGIYEPSDAKGAKWLACHIQATGQVQRQPCQTCMNNVGVFSECVILGGDDFPRCGNCEWNRQGCHGAALEPQPISKLAHQIDPHPGSRRGSQAGSKPASKPDPRTVSKRTSQAGSQAGSQPNSRQSSRPSSRHTIEDFQGVAPPQPSKQKPSDQASASAYDVPDDDEDESGVAGMRSKSSGRKPHLDIENAPATPEITKDILALRDDGVVFTDPPCMRNVPLVKISPSHAYWDPEWKSIEDHVQGILDMWLERHEQHLKDPKTTAASRFLANRQINRGRAVLQFLQEGELHPYQIIGKKYIQKTLLNYDTLHRMVQILGELKKFKLDVTPSEWLRHRLHELDVWSTKMGTRLDLGRTLSRMYHDPKVIQLRLKNGFGSIGRPRGSMAGEKLNPGDTPKETGEKTSGARNRKERGESTEASPSTRKRKERHETPKNAPQLELAASEKTPRSSQRKTRQHSTDAASTLQGSKEESQQASLSPRNAKKRQKVDHQPPVSDAPGHANLQHDLEYSGYTSHDSYSGDHVVTLDWRVYQVKTRKVTTNPAVTQYWHWVDNADGARNLFEHQVLKDVLPKHVTWGVYKDPFDFHLRLSELTNVSYSPDSQKLVIKTKPVPGVEHRGDVLAHFKRERTKRRFLAFMKRKGVKLVRTDA